MGETCNRCHKSCGIPPFSELPYGGIIDGKDYCAFCYALKMMGEEKKK